MNFKPLNLDNLINFSLFINTVCQLKCPYCYARAIKKWNQILSLHDCKGIINHLKHSKDFRISILGGEPTLHRNLNQILSELISLENCKEIEIFTNGLKLVSLPKSDKIKLFISYHGLYESTVKAYEFYSKSFKTMICVPDYYNSEKIINYIDRNKIDFHVQYIVADEIKTPELVSSNDYDKFIFNDNIVTLDEIIKNEISFRGWNCSMRYFLLEKNYILDECNHTKIPYSEIENLHTLRVCDYDCCFKNGDFLLYNEKSLD